MLHLDLRQFLNIYLYPRVIQFQELHLINSYVICRLCSDGSVRLFDIADGKCVRMLQGGAGNDL